MKYSINLPYFPLNGPEASMNRNTSTLKNGFKAGQGARLILAHGCFLLLLTAITFLFSSRLKPDIAGLPADYLGTHFFQHLLPNLILFYLFYSFLAKVALTHSVKFFLVGSLFCIGISTYLDVQLDLILIDNQLPDTYRTLVNYLIMSNLIANCFFSLCATFFRFTIDWFDNKNIEKALKLSVLEAELALLKSQTNPHFLFNTLNSLYSSAYQEGAMTTAKGINYLAEQLRYLLYLNLDDPILLSREITFIEQYIALQQLRFGDSLNINFSVHGANHDVRVYPMLLMPLVENAVKHGYGPKSDADIVISIVCKENKITVTTANPINTSTLASNKSGGLGLANVKDRLSYLYPQCHKFVVTVEDNIFNTYMELNSNEACHS
ncbi:sensor histidine kinase [Shewanella cyperi]|uniref:sensor histidine kinase n=1 Tax=Shewanella cyperi TaxID=2814292 RepID=UPI001A953F1A|nr:histidine kinase [Shewanella cyperi]QSX40705.1 histidine kinase [Shewanella cyperi]